MGNYWKYILKIMKKRFLKKDDLICTKNNQIYTVQMVNFDTKEIITKEKNYKGNSFIISFSEIYGAM
jgi:hypothetical protein